VKQRREEEKEGYPALDRKIQPQKTRVGHPQVRLVRRILLAKDEMEGGTKNALEGFKGVLNFRWVAKSGGALAAIEEPHRQDKHAAKQQGQRPGSGVWMMNSRT